MNKLIQIYSTLDPVTELFVASCVLMLIFMMMTKLIAYLFPTRSNQPQKF